jgi:hypothetical protein
VAFYCNRLPEKPTICKPRRVGIKCRWLREIKLQEQGFLRQVSSEADGGLDAKYRQAIISEGKAKADEGGEQGHRRNPGTIKTPCLLQEDPSLSLILFKNCQLVLIVYQNREIP